MLTLCECSLSVLGVRCVRHNGQRLNETRLKYDPNIERVFRQTNSVRVSVLSTSIAHFAVAVLPFFQKIKIKTSNRIHTLDVYVRAYGAAAVIAAKHT